jgi:cytosine/adenosine deaminase-related metal-dependent hydrolase
MNEEINSEMISRRGTFSLLGAAASLSVAVPATLLTAAEAAFGIRGTFLDFIEDPWRHVGRESKAARFHADGLLVVEDGRIADFGAHDEVAARHAGLVVTTIPDQLILPGFIDGHVHFPQTRVIGAFGEHLLSWLQKWVFPEEIKFKDRAYARVVAGRFFDNLLASGTTTCQAFTTAAPTATEELFDEAGRRNMRLGGAEGLYIDDLVGNFAPGKEADFVVLDCNGGPPALAWRQSLIAEDGEPRTLEQAADLLFGLMTVGDDRAIEQTWAMGRRVYRRRASN